MTSSPPSLESADDRLKDLGLLYDAAFQNSDYEWQGKQFTEAYDRLHRFVEAQQTDALRQRIDNAHADIYSVWNGGKLSAVDLNHLESALAILGHIIDELKSPRGGDTLSELRTQIEALIDKALADYIAGINKTMHVPGYSATVEIIKGIKGEALKLIDSAEARKR